MIKRILSHQNIHENFSKVLVTAIVFYFYKTAFWPLTYLFVVSYTVLVIFFLKRVKWEFKLLEFFHEFIVPIFLVLLYIIVLVVNGHFENFSVIKDLLLILVLFSLFYFLFWNDLVLKTEIPKSYTTKLIIITAGTISVINLITQFSLPVLNSGYLSRFNLSGGSAIANDYNYFSLFIIFSLIIINIQDKNKLFTLKISKSITLSLSLIFILNILISGSRRGIFVLLLLITIYILKTITNAYRSNNKAKFLKKTSIFFSIIFFIITVGTVVFKTVPRHRISNIIYRYALIIGVRDFKPIEQLLWKHETVIPEKINFIIDKISFKEKIRKWFDSTAPGTSISNIETPFGAGVKISRDRGDDAGFSYHYNGPKIIYYSNHTYKISFKIKFSAGDFNSFNLGWWVDDGGKGFANSVNLVKVTQALGDGWYTCTSEYTFIENHFGATGFINSVKNQSSFVITDFELEDLNSNNKLKRFVFEIDENGNLDEIVERNNPPPDGSNLISNGDFKHNLSFWKSTTQSSINIKIANIDGKKCALVSRGKGDNGGWSLFYNGRKINYKANNEYQIAFKLKPVSPNAIPFNIGFWVDEGEGYKIALLPEIDTLIDGWLDIKASYKFKNDHKDLLFPINSQISNSQFYITDISLINLTRFQSQADSESSANVSEAESQFSDRTSRWSYAIDLWKIKYKLYHKLFGHGFDYLEWYGMKFMPNQQTKSYDWPHNPFISILLYSGIFGLLLYMWLLYNAVLLYIKYLKQCHLFFFGFLLTFFFSFFSGSHPFDPPIMGFFILLPFFLHSMHNNAGNQLIRI